MFDRALDIRASLTETLRILAENQNYDVSISEDEWNIMDDACVLLTHLADATKSLSGSEYVTVSLILPTIRALIQEFNTFNSIKTKVGKKLKVGLVKNLKNRLEKYESNKQCHMATLLDPRLKKSGFECSYTAEATVCLLIQEIQSEHESDRESSVERETVPPKKARTETGFMTLLSNYVANQTEKANQNTDNVEEQVKSYLQTTVEPIDCDVYKWWHQRRTSRLYKQAMKYLAIPATSCPSERIFSTAGYILNQKRTRLSGHHVDQLLFLNENLY
jgi:hypothetical protein